MASSRLLLFSHPWFRVFRTLPPPSSSASFSSCTLRHLSYTSLPFLGGFISTSKLQNSPTHLPSFAFHTESTVFADSIENNVEPAPLGTSHPWPEWVSFMDRLKDKGYFDLDSPEKEDDTADKGGAIPKDLNRVRNACLGFARERFDLLRSLSKKDIQAIVECGCPNLFRKAVNSAKRLRAYVKLDEGDVCSTCNLRGSCDRAYVIAKEEEGARTVDIVRILLSYAIDPHLSGEKHPGKENVEASARKLLSELIKMSDTPLDPAFPKPAARSPREAKTSQKVLIARDNVEMKSGDWICTKCQFMNFARNIRCLGCKEDGPKRVGFDDVEMKKGDWTCPQCQFMNFARNTKCFRCQDSRPKRQLEPGEWECPSCDFLNYRRNMVCLKCNCERPKNTVMAYEDQIWRKPEVGGKTRGSRDIDDDDNYDDSWDNDDGDGAENGLKSAEFSGIMPPRKGGDKFLVTKKRTPSERRLTASRHRKS